jgi:hypothetical protein
VRFRLWRPVPVCRPADRLRGPRFIVAPTAAACNRYES